MRRTLVVLAALAITQSACFGSFAATRALYRFNKGISGDKFIQELLFLGLIIVPAYSLFVFGDVILFNSIEFWGGSNPIQGDSSQPREREVMLADGSSARLVQDADGMRIEHGGKVLLVQRSAGGMILVAEDGTVLAAIHEGENGAVEVSDAAGNVEIVRADELAAAGDSAESITAWTLARAAQ